MTDRRKKLEVLADRLTKARLELHAIIDERQASKESIGFWKALYQHIQMTAAVNALQKSIGVIEKIENAVYDALIELED